ncbi:MAG: type II toxin-antitoxin system VapC family toxin [Promethearchaeota archaeon]
MPIYIDTNVFYNAYCPIEDRFAADWLLKQIDTEFPGITSEWTILEMFRAFKKQVNLERIEDRDAQITIDLFLSELGESIQRKKIILIPVKMGLIMTSRTLIFNQNLYAADAIHVTSATEMKVDAFITFDSHFKKLKTIPILNPQNDIFQDSILQLKANYIKKMKKE